MILDSIPVNTTLRLKTLEPSGPVLTARVERVDGRRILVLFDGVLHAGTAVQLDASDRMLLAETISAERTPNGMTALLEIQHSVSHADLSQIRVHALESEAQKADAAGA